MKTVTIRDVPDDVLTLIKSQAKRAGQSQNDYILDLLKKTALVGYPDFAKQLPETIRYIVRSILLEEQDRQRAYTEAQMALIKDCMKTLAEVNERLNTMAISQTPD